MNLENEVKLLFQNYGIHTHTDSGNEVTIYCPFHQNRNTPSFYINKKTGLWQCFNPSCGKKGNFRQLYRQITGKAYGKATSLDPVALKKELEKALSPVITDEEITIDTLMVDYSSDDAKEKFSSFLERGLEMKTLQYFDVCYSETKKRVVIPVRSHDFKIMGLIGRATSTDQEPRYLYNTGFKRAIVLFNLQNAKRHDSVIVVEGSVDAMKVHQAGFPNVVATLGAQVSAQQAKLLKRYFDKIIIFSDKDDAGDAMKRAIISSCCGKEIYSAEVPEDAKDPGELTVKEIQTSITNKQIII